MIQIEKQLVIKKVFLNLVLNINKINQIRYTLTKKTNRIAAYRTQF